jgi:hypothetical protein
MMDREVEAPRSGQPRPPVDRCPHCGTDGLETSLEASLGRVNTAPVLVHRTHCPACDAQRTVHVDLERLGRNALGNTGWDRYPGMGSLADHTDDE